MQAIPQQKPVEKKSILRKLWLWILIGIVLILLFLTRHYVHPFAIELRKNLFIVTVFLPIGLLCWLLVRKRTVVPKLLVMGLYVGFMATMFMTNFAPYYYVNLWYRYVTLPKLELTTLPTTEHERIHPLHSAYTLANFGTDTTQEPTEPHFVRVADNDQEHNEDDEFRWTVGVHPLYFVPRFTKAINEVWSAPAITPSPSFSQLKNRNTVCFDVGEYLWLEWNTYNSVVKHMYSPLLYWNYEPSDARFMKDDTGEWVQVITLVKWSGIFSIFPEFGGVYVIKQTCNSNVLEYAVRTIVGEGTWIPPEKIHEYPFLTGQNLVPYTVSRYNAHSFRYQSGFIAPLPNYHVNDVRLPDLPEDLNPLPFTIFANALPQTASHKLYHYSGLEPYHEGKQGLNTSVFGPGDGIGPTLYYPHYLHKEGLTGSSAIAGIVMGSKKEYDWAQSRPKEHRPYIKLFDGKIRFLWMTTIVTFKECQIIEDKKFPEEKDPATKQEALVKKECSKLFTAGGTPEIAFTDAQHVQTVWIDRNKNDPRLWPEQIEAVLGPIWKQE